MTRLLALCLTLLTSTATAQTCGGPLPAFIAGVKAEAIAAGQSAANVDRFFAGAKLDEAVIKADRAQGVFQKDFISFSNALISQNRIDNGRIYDDGYHEPFDVIEREYGVSRGVLLAFWAFETDFGQVQGSFNTRNALLTLAHDCRRPELFRPQLIAGIELMAQGGLDPATTTGAWAGEIGQVQMLPLDILERGRDGDGDGIVDLKGSAQDALYSGANVLSSLGWRANERWLTEIIVPRDLDWRLTGLDTKLTVADWTALGVRARHGGLGRADMPASVLLPMGRDGPAFLAYQNFDVFFEWNKSFVYVTTAAFFATLLEGAAPYLPGNPTPPLSGEQMIDLQLRLENRGHDVGGIDGILGAKTRAAVQAEQVRLGLPADAWPTLQLLNAL